jgi:hypothetical protein
MLLFLQFACNALGTQYVSCIYIAIVSNYYKLE